MTEVEAKYCDSCGRNLLVTLDNGSTTNLAALQIVLNAEDSVIKQALEPYKNKEYNFCYVCVLQTFGADPDVKT